MLYEQRHSSVLIVSSSQKSTDYLTASLNEIDGAQSTVVSTAGEARRRLISEQFDLILINTPLKDENGLELAIDLAEETLSGIILFVRETDYEQITDRVEWCGILTVPKPVHRQSVMQAIHLALATKARIRRVEKKNDKLIEKLDEFRLVNRAKWVLIEKLKMDEAQAHKYVEKLAMDLRISKKDAAENIIKTYES